MSYTKPSNPILQAHNPLDINFGVIFHDLSEGWPDIAKNEEWGVPTSSKIVAGRGSTTEVTYANYLEGQILNLSGVNLNSYISLPVTTLPANGTHPMNVAGNNFSMAFRLYTANGTTNTMYISQQGGWSFWRSASLISLNKNDSVGAATWTLSTPAGWYDMILVRNGVFVNLWVNGVPLTQVNFGPTVLDWSSTNPMRLGGWWTTGYQMAGSWSHFIMSNRAWSTHEVQQMFHDPYAYFDNTKPYALNPF